MAANIIPKRADLLFTYASDNIQGLVKKEKTVGVKQNTAKVLGKALDEARRAETAYQTGSTELATKLSPRQKKADADAKKYISDATKTLRAQLGTRWSQAWPETGFVNNSTAIPTKIAARESTMKSLADFFVANPHREVKDLSVTAKRAQAIHAELVAAREAVSDRKSDLRTLRDQRDAAFKNLRKRLIGLIGELNTLLTTDSPVWRAFGLNVPADPNPKPKEAKKADGTASAAKPAKVTKTRKGTATPESNAASEAAPERTEAPATGVALES